MRPPLFLFLFTVFFLQLNPNIMIASASKPEKDIPLEKMRSPQTPFQGNPMAMVEEGLLYYNGTKKLNDGKPHNYPKIAADLFEKALGCGEKTVKDLVAVPLGDIYYFGTGRKQSYEKALEYYPQDLEVLDKDPALEARVGLSMFHVESARTGKRPLKNALIDRAIERGYWQVIEEMVTVYLREPVYVHIDYFWPYISSGTYTRNSVTFERAMKAVANILPLGIPLGIYKDGEQKPPKDLPKYKGDYWGGYFEGMHTGNLLKLNSPLKEMVYHTVFAVHFNILSELNKRLIEWHQFVKNIEHKSFLITAVHLAPSNCQRLKAGDYKQLSCLSCTHHVKSTHAVTFGIENNIALSAYVSSEWMKDMPKKLAEGISASRYLLNELERLHTVVLQDAVQQSRQQTAPTEPVCDMSQLITVKTALEQYAPYLNTIQEHHAFLFTSAGQAQRNYAFRQRYGHLFYIQPHMG